MSTKDQLRVAILSGERVALSPLPQKTPARPGFFVRVQDAYLCSRLRGGFFMDEKNDLFEVAFILHS